VAAALLRSIAPLLAVLAVLGSLDGPSPRAAAREPDAALTLRLIAFNDFHGHLEPGEMSLEVPDPRNPQRTTRLRVGGAAHLAGRIAQLRREQPRSVVVSAGDMVGASPLTSALFRDEPTVEVMNLIGLELNAAGNHEFDHGVDELRRLIGGGCASEPRGKTLSCAHPGGHYEGARFAFLAANVVDEQGRPLLPPFRVVEVDGIRIGFIGAVTRSTPGIVLPAGIRGWRFEDEAEAINRAARELLAQGVRALVAVVHEGGEADGGFNACENPRGEIFSIARRLDPAIAVIVSGHTHRAYVCRIDGRLIVQSGAHGQMVAVLDLAVDPRRGTVDIAATAARNEPVANGLQTGAALRAAYPPAPPDPVVARLVDHYRTRAAPLAQKPAGRIAAPFERLAGPGGDSAAGRLIADAQLAATRSNGAQIAFVNPGGIRTDLVARPNDGTVTFADAFAMQPFGNALVTMSLTGAQILALLESQWNRGEAQRQRLLQPSRGFTYAWRAAAPAGSRVDRASVRIDGELLREERTYRVTVNQYLAEGGGGLPLLREGTDRVVGPLDVDALVAYLRSTSRLAPLRPDPRSRIVRLD
jgi:5'-nucleotidase